VALLGAMVAEPDVDVWALPLLSAAERRQVVDDWNATEAPYPREACVHELIEAQVARTPDAVAVRDGEVALTYAELEAAAEWLSHRLRGAGVGPGDRVGVCMKRSADLIVAMLATLKASAAYVPLEPSLPAARLEQLVRDSSPRIILVDAANNARAFGGIPPGTMRIDGVSRARAETNAWPVAQEKSSARWAAYVMYTSGTSGQPKGVVVPHQAIVRLVFGTEFEVQPDEVVAQLATTAFDAATYEIWSTLIHGATLAVLDMDEFLGTADPDAELRKAGVTSMFLSTPVFNQLGLTFPRAFASLRTLVVGGDRIDPAAASAVLKAGAPQRLVNGYGPTETTTFATSHRVSLLDCGGGGAGIPIGAPIANTTAYVVDAAGAPVPVGIIGELWIGGPGVALYYLGRPALTADRFVPDPFGREPGARLYRTGDLARWRADGVIEFAGRLDRQVKLRGFRIEPDEIERTLLSEGAVRQAVVTLQGDGEQRRLVAYVVPREGTDDGDAAAGAARAPIGGDVHLHVGDWQRFYDELYRQSPSSIDPTFNTIGWNSSYIREPLPAEDMQEWLNHTTDVVRTFAPRRILEIGCGTGLLLYRLAPGAERYVGTDFSSVSLDLVREQLHRNPLPQVELLECMAEDFSAIEAAAFDAVILNSVVQYFPSHEYLIRVLEGARRALVPGGVIIVGDVRSLPLLEAFTQSRVLSEADDQVQAGEVRSRVSLLMDREEELLLDPLFFHAAAQRIGGFDAVHVQPKRGYAQNELTKYRYTAILRAAGPARAASSVSAPAGLDWGGDVHGVDSLTQHLRAATHDRLLVRRIPNGRVGREVAEAAALRRLAAGLTARDALRDAVPAASVDPEELFALAEAHGFAARATWTLGASDGTLDMLFRRRSTADAASVSFWEPFDGVAASFGRPMPSLANEPLRAKRNRELVPTLRTVLSARLPEYMVPAAIVVLDRLPLNANGKLDLAALPAPLVEQEVVTERAAIETPTERAIAEIWSEVLKARVTGATQDFFELGGHSLLAARVVARMRKALSIELPIRILFEAPTVRELARHVDDMQRQTLELALANLDQLSDDDIQRLLADS